MHHHAPSPHSSLRTPLPSLLTLHSAFFTQRRRAGKIAKLPPTVRAQINVMLQDGVPYAQIIINLGDAGKNLNKDNLPRWRKADHQDWLQQQLWLQITRDHPEFANNPTSHALVQFDPALLHDALTRKPSRIIHVCNSIAKLSMRPPPEFSPPPSTAQ